MESFKASQREVDSVNVLSHPGDFCERYVIVTASSSVAASRRATTVGAAGAGAGILFRFQKVNSGSARLSRRVHTVFRDLSLANKAVKFSLEWHREVQ